MPNKVSLSPPPTVTESGLAYHWVRWFENLFTRIGAGPFLIQGYQVSGLPIAADWGGSEFSSLIFVSDEVGGPTLAFSDGTNWRRVQDRAIVS